MRTGTQQTMYRRSTSFLPVARSKTAGNTGIETHSKTHSKRKGEILQRVDQRDGCEGLLTHMGYKDAVNNIV